MNMHAALPAPSFRFPHSRKSRRLRIRGPNFKWIFEISSQNWFIVPGKRERSLSPSVKRFSNAFSLIGDFTGDDAYILSHFWVVWYAYNCVQLCGVTASLTIPWTMWERAKNLILWIKPERVRVTQRDRCIRKISADGGVQDKYPNFVFRANFVCIPNRQSFSFIRFL